MGFPRKTLRTLNSIFSETVNVKKLANLTANNKDYGQITLNATHAGPLQTIVSFALGSDEHAKIKFAA